MCVGGDGGGVCALAAEALTRLCRSRPFLKRNSGNLGHLYIVTYSVDEKLWPMTLSLVDASNQRIETLPKIHCCNWCHNTGIKEFLSGDVQVQLTENVLTKLILVPNLFYNVLFKKKNYNFPSFLGGPTLSRGGGGVKLLIPM